YPRDFRSGRFKFTSTPVGKKPTDEDLRKTLMEGIEGTAMPSFKLLAEEEFTAALNYLKYLSIRGEVERRLIYELAQLDAQEGERLIDLSLRETEPDDFKDQEEIIKETVASVAKTWRDAEESVTEVPDQIVDVRSNEEIRDLVERGRQLFHGDVAACSKCHGALALGDGQTTDYDEWTKELEPENEEALAEYLSAGALTPRNIIPRNLRLGVYRGGRRPQDLYWRIANGIEGTPMPAALLKADDAPPEVQGLNTEDVRALIEYVRSLPYEEINRAPYELENKRNRS
ncbi:MAG: cytochrome c, partial [bacterium]|nr:cytochrome c [bacterium]